MPLIDDVKAACDRLAPLGWRDLLMAVTDGELDIAQPSAGTLAKTLRHQLREVDRTRPGFDDFDASGVRGVTPSRPEASLLYHALASPRVVRDAGGAILRGFPTVPEIEAVENFVFGARPPTLERVVSDAGGRLAVVSFATEYRPAPDCAGGTSAALTFSRTGIARVGTARPKYVASARGWWSEDEDNAHAFRVVPVRFTAWLAAPRPGGRANVMRLGRPNDMETRREFWIPVHKLFDGAECLQGTAVSLRATARFFNMKLQRVFASLPKPQARSGFPYVVEEGLAELHERSEFGRLAVVPVVHERLVEPARDASGQLLTFPVPQGSPNDRFATYSTEALSRQGLDAEIHRWPAYVHARTKVEDGRLVNLNDMADVNAEVVKGGYDALLYRDMTGEGWLDVEVPELVGAPGVDGGSKPAYVLLSAPDFFPSCGQRELTAWATSMAVPGSFRGGQIWAVPPAPLSETRRPANLQLPGSPFAPADDTMTAVVGMGSGGRPPSMVRSQDTVRASTLPDDGAGEYAPGWDVSVDVLGDVETGVPHLAAYGLGSPFPEDAKLCAALSTFWPAVSPDVYRTMSPHTGNPNLRGTVAPLTDEEIGQVGELPWDGVGGPKLVRIDEQDFVEMASFQHVDYVVNAVENRFSTRLTARVTTEEYQRRVLAAARVHWALSGGIDVRPTRTRWLFLSFRHVSGGDVELQTAQTQAGKVLQGPVYRVEVCSVDGVDPTVPIPGTPRRRRMPVHKRNFFFVSADDPHVLRRRETDAQFRSVAGE